MYFLEIEIAVINQINFYSKFWLWSTESELIIFGLFESLNNFIKNVITKPFYNGFALKLKSVSSTAFNLLKFSQVENVNKPKLTRFFIRN